MAGQPLGTIGRIRAGLTGIALAVPGVGAISSGIAAIGAAVATISAPVWGTFAVVAAAVAAAGFTIYRYWDRISAIFSGVGQAVGEALQPGLEWISERLSFLNPIVTAFGDAWQWVRDRVSGIGELLSGMFGRETLSEEEVASITARAREVTENIIGFFAGLPSRIGEAAGNLAEAGGQMIQSLWDGAVQKFDEFVAWLTGIPGRIVSAIGNIDLSSIIRWPSPPAWFSRLTGGSDAAMEGFSEDFGVDGQRAKGGPISRGGDYLVGENGPELITANRNGYVNPTGQGGMGGSVEVSINAPINVNGGVSDPQQLAAEISRQLRDQVREAMRGVFADTGMRIA